MSNRTVSTSYLRKQAEKLLKAFDNELSRVNQAKEQITALKEQLDELKALDGTVVEKTTTESTSASGTTYTTITTYLDVFVTDGGMDAAFARFNENYDIFIAARDKLVNCCQIIYDCADQIDENYEEMLEALLGLGSNVPIGNNGPIIPGNNGPVIPGNNGPVIPGNNGPVIPGNNGPVIPGNNGSVPPSNNDPVVPPSNNDPVIPPSNNVTPPPTGGDPQPRIDPPEPTRTPTPTPSPTPSPTPTPTPTPTPSPTPTPTPSPTPTPTATGYEPIPYTGINNEKKNNLIASMAFPLGAAVAAAGVGAAIHEGLSRYNEAKEKKEEEEFDELVDRENAVSRIKERNEPFTVEAARVAAEAGQSIRDSLKLKHGEEDK